MGLTKDDLIQKCSACGGEGWIYDPPRNLNQGSYGVRSAGMQYKESCTVCRQAGEVLTEEGKAIASVISLMRRRGDL
jgi:hypothetical protein